MKKWLLGFLLALVLCLALLSVSATAVEHTDHDNGWTALTGQVLQNNSYTLSGAGVQYYLNEDITTSTPIQVTGNVTLCLNGKTYTYNGNGTECAIEVQKDASLTICSCQSQGSDYASGQIIAGMGAGNAIVNNGTLTVTGGQIISNTENCAAIWNNGTLTVSGGSISGTAQEGTYPNLVKKTAYGVYNNQGADLAISGAPSITGSNLGPVTNPTGPQIDILTYNAIDVSGFDVGEWLTYMPSYNIGFYGQAGDAFASGIDEWQTGSVSEWYDDYIFYILNLSHPENADWGYDSDTGELILLETSSMTFCDSPLTDGYYTIGEDGSIKASNESNYTFRWAEESKTLTLREFEALNTDLSLAEDLALFEMTNTEGPLNIVLEGTNQIEISSSDMSFTNKIFSSASGITVSGEGALEANLKVTGGSPTLIAFEAAGEFTNEADLTVSGSNVSTSNGGNLTAVSAGGAVTNAGSFMVEMSGVNNACAVDTEDEFVNQADASIAITFEKITNGTGLDCKAFENTGTVEIEIDAEDRAAGIYGYGKAGNWANLGEITINVGLSGSAAGALGGAPLAGVEWRSDSAYQFTNAGTLTVTASSAQHSTQIHTNWPTWQFFDTMALCLMPGDGGASTVENTGTMTLAAHNGYTAGLYVGGTGGDVTLKNSGTMDIDVDTLGGDNIRAIGIFAQISNIPSGTPQSLPFQVTAGKVEIDATAASGASNVMDGACMAVCLSQSFNEKNAPVSSQGLQQIQLEGNMSVTRGGSLVVMGPYDVPKISNNGIDCTAYINTIGSGLAPAAAVTIEPYTPSPVTPSYPVTVPETEHGTVTTDPTNASAGREVTIIVEPDPGYELDELNVTDKNGNNVNLEKKGENRYSFTMPSGGVVIHVTFRQLPLPFKDVAKGVWYYDAVHYVYYHNIMAGISEIAFAPNTTLSRAMVAQILYNLEDQPAVAGESTFTDVATHWAADAITWAQQTGVVEGYENNTFRPNRAVSREELAQMLYNYAEYKEYDLTAQGDLTSFPDGGQVSDWAEEAMAWATGNKLINGFEDGALRPGGDSTRAQVASILMNFDLNLVEE